MWNRSEVDLEKKLWVGVVPFRPDLTFTGTGVYRGAFSLIFKGNQEPSLLSHHNPGKSRDAG